MGLDGNLGGAELLIEVQRDLVAAIVVVGGADQEGRGVSAGTTSGFFRRDTPSFRNSGARSRDRSGPPRRISPALFVGHHVDHGPAGREPEDADAVGIDLKLSGPASDQTIAR